MARDRRPNILAALGWSGIGLLAVAGYNWHLWQRNRALATTQREAPAPLPQLARTPQVSVLVAAWNEREHIAAHIQSFLALNYPHCELILCAGGSDGTLEIAQRYASPRVIVLEQQPGEGKQSALARCMALARGEIIYLTDADCRYRDAALIHLLAPLINAGEQVATGASCPLEEQTDKLLPAYLWAADTFVAAHAPPYTRGLLGRNTALTHQAIVQSGGLDFSAPTGTDYQLAQRLLASGIAIRYVAASVVPTEYPERLPIYQRKRSRWLRNLLRYGPRYGAWADLRATLTTVASGAVMLLAPFSTPLLGNVVLLPWLLLLAHAYCAKLRYIHFAALLHQQPVRLKLLLGLIPLTLIEFGIWVTPVFDLLRRGRSNRW